VLLDVYFAAIFDYSTSCQHMFIETAYFPQMNERSPRNEEQITRTVRRKVGPARRDTSEDSTPSHQCDPGEVTDAAAANTGFSFQAFE
jgi:hypothetical protein